LRIRDPNQTAQTSSRRTRSWSKKHVHYEIEDPFVDKEVQSGIVRRKEDIPIPDPVRKPLSRGDRILVFIMAADDGPSRMHGLHGKKLM